MNESKNRTLIVRICVVAVMAALVALSSKLQIQVPAVVGVSRFHLGNTMCALSGILLGPWWGGLASGLGSIIFDLTDPMYIAETPITFVIKGLYGVVAGAIFFKVFRRKSNYVSEVVSTGAAAATYIILYLAKNFFYNGMLLHELSASASWVAMLQKAPSSVFNGVVAVIIAPILSVALYKALKAAHLDRILT